MNRETTDLIGAIFIEAFGLLFLLAHKRMGKVASEQQRKFFGVEAGEKKYQICFLIGGLIFIVLGFLSLISRNR